MESVFKILFTIAMLALYAMVMLVGATDVLFHLNIKPSMFVDTVWAAHVNWVFGDIVLFIVGLSGSTRWANRLEKWKDGTL